MKAESLSISFLTDIADLNTPPWPKGEARNTSQIRKNYERIRRTINNFPALFPDKGPIDCFEYSSQGLGSSHPALITRIATPKEDPEVCEGCRLKDICPINNPVVLKK